MIKKDKKKRQKLQCDGQTIKKAIKNAKKKTQHKTADKR